MNLSLRLDAVLAALQPCQRLADVGTDHGHVPIAAVQRDIARTAIAADLRAAPLSIARQNVALAGVSERVALLRGDGLLALTGQGVDAVVMAGVSGKLMRHLCESAPAVLAGLQQLVLQPNKDVAIMRAWARGNGLHLHDERLVYERGRFFVICAFHPAHGADPAYSVRDFDAATLCRVGPLLLARQHPLAARMYEEQLARIRPLVDAGVRGLCAELADWQAARAYLERFR